MPTAGIFLLATIFDADFARVESNDTNLGAVLEASLRMKKLGKCSLCNCLLCSCCFRFWFWSRLCYEHTFIPPHGNVRLRNGSRKVYIGEKKARVELDGATEKSRNFPKNGLVRAIDLYERASNFWCIARAQKFVAVSPQLSWQKRNNAEQRNEGWNVLDPSRRKIEEGGRTQSQSNP